MRSFLIFSFLLISITSFSQVELKYPSSPLVEFAISAEEKYIHGGPIAIVLSWRNNSSKREKILVCKEFTVLYGASGSIRNSAGQNLENSGNRASLISKVMSSEDFKNFEVYLEPGEIWTETLDLRFLLYFKDPYGFEKHVPPGTYKIQISYYGKKSEVIGIELY